MVALRLALGLGLPLLICHSALFPDEPKKEPADTVGKLLDQLGHPRYIRREEATKQLIQLGETILDRVRKHGHETKEFDTQIRCERVIRGIVANCNLSKSTGMTFVPINPGWFAMGSPIGERARRGDEPEHRIRITEPFVMGVYEVTQGEYTKITGKSPSAFSPTGESKDRVGGKDTSRFPVENVSWFDAVNFCNELSRKDGYKPYYKIADPRTKDNSILDAKVTIEGGNGYHLPTEAQWEYACRAGTTLPFHFGRQNRGKDANTRPGPATGYGGDLDFNAINRTVDVGSYAKNAWGLFDMCGNVGEWCWDWYDKDYYLNSPEKDPSGPKTGTHRVTRGGSWMIPESSCRSATRAFFMPDSLNSASGFRVIRQP